MKPKTEQSQRLTDLLRAAHGEREALAVDRPWQLRTMQRVRYLAAAGRAPAARASGEALFWRWMALGGMAAAMLVVVLLNFQFIADADLWSFLLYENETLTMMQAFLY